MKELDKNLLLKLIGINQQDLKMTEAQANTLINNMRVELGNAGLTARGRELIIYLDNEERRSADKIYNTIMQYYNAVELDIISNDEVGDLDRFEFYLIDEYENILDEVGTVGTSDNYDLNKLELTGLYMIPEQLVEDFDSVTLIYLDLDTITHNNTTSVVWSLVHEMFHSLDRTQAHDTIANEIHTQKNTLNYLLKQDYHAEVIIEYINQVHDFLNHNILPEYDIHETIENVLQANYKELWSLTLAIMEELEVDELNNYAKRFY